MCVTVNSACANILVLKDPPLLSLSCRKPGKGKVKQKTNVMRATLVLSYVNLVIVMRLYSLVRYIHIKKKTK